MVMNLWGAGGGLLSAAPPLCAVRVYLSRNLCVLFTLWWLPTRAAASRLCPASQLHWLPWALPTGREADCRLCHFLTLHPLHLVFSASSQCIAERACFARLPRHNDRIPVGDTQRRLPTWGMPGWFWIFWAFPFGLRPDRFLLDDAQRGSRCLYVSP